MLTRKFNIGETRKATVEEIGRKLVVVVDEFKEGHFLIGMAHDPNIFKGQTGTLTFTAGGPMGGYWKFTGDPKK